MRNSRLETATAPTDAHSFLTSFEFANSNFESSVADAAFGRLITFARVNLVFLLLAFLIDDAQRAPVGSNEFHFYFVEFAVLPAAGRRERKTVLVTKESGDVAENIRHFAIELREPCEPAGLLGEGFELILCLQEIHALHSPVGEI